MTAPPHALVVGSDVETVCWPELRRAPDVPAYRTGLDEQWARRLAAVAGIVTPDTILRWHRLPGPDAGQKAAPRA